MRDPAPPILPATSDRHTLLSLQVLRALAALSVVIHHAGYDADTLALRAGRQPLGLDRVFDWTFGIHIFFVISGFIMVRTARGFGGRGAAMQFLIRRLLRVAPLYWLLTSLVLVGAAWAPALLNVPVDGWGLVLGSYLFVPATRINGEIRPVLGQGWTLNFEMFFYELFAAAMLFPRRTGLGLLALTLVALVAAGRLFAPPTPALSVWTDELLLEFLAGIGIGLSLEAGWRLKAVDALALGLAGLALAVALGPANGTALDPLIGAGLPAMMILTACTLGPVWPRHPALVALGILGDASYSLYLTHPFTIRLLRVGWEQVGGPAWPPGVFFILATLAAIVVSLIVHRSVERPMTMALYGRMVGKPDAKRQGRTPGGALPRYDR